MKYLFILVLILSANDALAQGYTPLEPLPFITNNSGSVDIGSFVPGVVRLAIALAGGLAVIRIIIGGIQYMTSEAWGGKSEAKSTITNALLGLILAIAAAGILAIINPALLSLNLGLTPLEGVKKSISGDLGPTGTKSAAEVECNNECVAVPSEAANLPIKPPGQGCSNDPCYLNLQLIEKLKGLKADFGATGWQITEAFPPTVPHIDNCHKPNTSETGKCADIALTTDTSTSTVIRFIQSMQKQEFRSFTYEVCPESDRRQYVLDQQIRDAGLVNYFSCYSTTRGRHAHVEI